MFNKKLILVSNQTPDYLSRYGYTVQTEYDKDNLFETENIIWASQNQMYDISEFNVDGTAKYKLSFFIDTPKTKPLDEDRTYYIQFACYAKNGAELGYVSSYVYPYNTSNTYNETITFNEETTKVRCYGMKYPNSNPNMETVVFRGLQLHKVPTKLPEPEQPILITPLVSSGLYYIEDGNDKYEFSLPNLHGIAQYRDIFYFDRKKKTAKIISNIDTFTISDITNRYNDITSDAWQRDGCTSFYSVVADENIFPQNDSEANKSMFNRFSCGSWEWSNNVEVDGNNYALLRGNTFYCIVNNSYTGITSNDTNDEKITKIKEWIKENPIECVFISPTAKTTPVQLVKVTETSATKLDIWEE